MIDNIEWKDIPGYEGLYQVSNTGLIKSVNRKALSKNGVVKTLSGRILSGCVDDKGYHRVILSRNGRTKSVTIHRQVALAFIANPDNKRVVNHIDSNPSNNHLSNLEWCTHSENTVHGMDHGNINNKGEGSYQARLKTADVLQIRSDPGSLTEIAAKFGICFQHVSDIKNRKKWAHV